MNWKKMSWLIAVGSLVSFLGFSLILSKNNLFMSGELTNGHHQMENSCESCHRAPFEGVDQGVCLSCHQQDLIEAKDTHAVSIFKWLPERKKQLELVNVGQCALCHMEHKPDLNQAMGVTVSNRFCESCHARVTQKHASHSGFSFDTCVGCHNFHDNTALNQKFLKQSRHQETTFLSANLPTQSNSLTTLDDNLAPAISSDAPSHFPGTDKINQEWLRSDHAQGKINCSGCHQSNSTDEKSWNIAVKRAVCAECHSAEEQAFLRGRHGMKNQIGLPPMHSQEARISVTKDSHTQPPLDCQSCHKSHLYDTQTAAVEGCLECHNDSHSLGYQKSQHYQLWQAEQKGDNTPGSGVSCASCHFPRLPHDGPELGKIKVVHNPNFNLRPNQKMVNSVCNHCHGVIFSLDALADQRLIQNNFQGVPRPRNQSVKKHYTTKE